MYVGHKLKVEKVDKIVAKMAPHLESGEEVLGIAVCNNMRPLVDRIVITDQRLLALHATDSIPRWSCQHTMLLDVVSVPKKQTFTAYASDGREQVFKMVRAEDHAALLDILNQRREVPLAGTGVTNELRRELSEAASAAKAVAAAPTPVQQLAIDQGFPAKHRALIEPLLAYLDTAVEAAAKGDILAEERALWEGAQLAGKAGLIAVSGPKWFEARVHERASRGELRRGVDFIGAVGANLKIMSDRILQGGRAYILDADVKASVEVDGQILQSSRPTLTRMAVGSVLPGSALLVGLAVPKTKTDDKRSAQFVLVHPQWRIVERLDPDSAHQLTGLAAQITAIAESLQRREARESCQAAAPPAGPIAAPSTMDLSKVADELSKLAGLRDAGVLTEEEFATAKARLLA